MKSSQSTRHADDFNHYNTQFIDLTLELNSQYSDVKAQPLLSEEMYSLGLGLEPSFPSFLTE